MSKGKYQISLLLCYSRNRPTGTISVLNSTLDLLCGHLRLWTWTARWVWNILYFDIFGIKEGLGDAPKIEIIRPVRMLLQASVSMRGCKLLQLHPKYFSSMWYKSVRTKNIKKPSCLLPKLFHANTATNPPTSSITEYTTLEKNQRERYGTTCCWATTDEIAK